MRMILTLPLLALTAACGSVYLPNTGAAPGPGTAPLGISPAPGATPDGPDTCGRAQFELLIGQPVGDAAAFRDAGATFRVIYPGDAVTDDFSPSRINVYANALGIVESLDCF